jgi:hypothetical protein
MLSTSLESFIAKYSEPSFMNQEGMMNGFNVKYTYRPKKNDMFYFGRLNVFGIQGQWAKGKLDYSSGDGTIEGLHTQMAEIRGIMGGDFYPDSMVRVTPYFGFGHRYIRNEGANRLTSFGVPFYDRISNYYYLPLGMDVLYQPTSLYGIEGNLEYDHLLIGKQMSELGALGYTDLSHTQKHGSGVRASLKLIRNFKTHDLFVEGFWRYWKIEDSEELGFYYEPNNTTDEVGLRLGLQI